jgi:hypothetical protein
MYERRLRRRRAGPSVVAAPPAPDPARDTLRRIVSEVVILQDQAEAMLDTLRDERDLGDVAPTCGRLIGRFVVLGEALKGWAEPALAPQVALVRAILDHHVLLLNSALMFLASEWRSDRLTRQLDALDGLGAPARRLERVWADLGPGPAAESP